MFVRITLVPLAALLLAAEPAVPQPAAAPPGPPPAPLDAAARREVVESAGRLLIEGYVYEDRARQIAAKLSARTTEGRYDTLTNRADFARVLTKDLREIGGDRHLRVLPDTGAAVGTPRFVRMPASAPGAPGAPGGPGGPGPRRMMPPGAGPPPGGRVPVNDGFARIAILDGNIGYVDMRGFHGTESARARVDSMMTAFAAARVKALIIDLGRNGGGDGFMVAHLSTYLFDETTHLVSQQMRGEEQPMERWTFEEVPGPRLAKTPVYVLTSDTTFSAAESFAFGLKINGRATLVGGRTGGGGHFGRVEPIARGFSLWLPHGRTYDPRTGKGWEATGIEPDVAVPYDQALKKALELSRAG
jgi:hypothetical protein